MTGVDVAFTKDGKACIAGAVSWDRRSGEVVERHTATRPLRFPYVPGLLSFRETPAVLAALRGLRRVPDAVVCDGQSSILYVDGVPRAINIVRGDFSNWSSDFALSLADEVDTGGNELVNGCAHTLPGVLDAGVDDVGPSAQR